MSLPFQVPPLPPGVQPLEVVAHQQSLELELAFTDGVRARVPFECLRVLSPSAEVQGHSPDQAILQTGKRGVRLLAVEPVGHYAVKLSFSDGHDSGLYTWPYLYHLCQNHLRLWQEHLDRLEQAGLDRDTPMPSPRGGCH